MLLLAFLLQPIFGQNSRISALQSDTSSQRDLEVSDLSEYSFLILPEDDRPYTEAELEARTPADDSGASSALQTAAAAKVNSVDEVLEPESELPCQCTDVRPREGFDGPPGESTCFDVARQGQCGDDYITDTQEELPEGFCQISCGRCACCDTFYERLRSLGDFEEFLRLAEATTFDASLQEPGYTSTLLVPTDAAFAEAYAELGQPDYELQSDADQLTWRQILTYHSVAPEPTFKALWTTPFMSSGSNLTRQTDAADQDTFTDSFAAEPLRIVKIGDNVTVRGAASSARILSDRDIEVCKGFISAVDAVLLPYQPDFEASAEPPVGLPDSAEPVPGSDLSSTCRSSSVDVTYAGDILLITEEASADECCERCVDLSECTTWSFCAQPEGCSDDTGSFFYLQCTLYSDTPSDSFAIEEAGFAQRAVANG